MEGFIKLSRKLLDWEWYSDANTLKLWIHLLLKANWQDGVWNGIKVPRGSLITSRIHLAKETGMSEQQVRTALSHLQLTNEITRKPTNKFTMITIVKWEDYQGIVDDINQQTPNKTSSNQPQYKNNKNNKKKEKGNSLNRFNQMENRTYDFVEMEKRLLQ